MSDDVDGRENAPALGGLEGNVPRVSGGPSGDGRDGPDFGPHADALSEPHADAHRGPHADALSGPHADALSDDAAYRDALNGFVHINGIPIYNLTMTEALPLIEQWVRQGERKSVYFVNANCMNISAIDQDYVSALLRKDTAVFGDGIGIRLAGRISQQPVRDNVNGTDMFPLLCRQSASNGQRIYLLGGHPGVADRARRKMSARFPGVEIVGTHDGYFDDPNPVIDQINGSGAGIVLVGLGVPRQELFIDRHRDRLQPTVVMGVGGLFDYYSGRIRRAPPLLRNNGLEWTWRLAMEPRRMWRRYLVGNFTFMGRVMWWQMTGRNRPWVS